MISICTEKYGSFKNNYDNFTAKALCNPTQNIKMIDNMLAAHSKLIKVNWVMMISNGPENKYIYNIIKIKILIF